MDQKIENHSVESAPEWLIFASKWREKLSFNLDEKILNIVDKYDLFKGTGQRLSTSGVPIVNRAIPAEFTAAIQSLVDSAFRQGYHKGVRSTSANANVLVNSTVVKELLKQIVRPLHPRNIWKRIRR